MSNALQTTLDNILTEKSTKLIPENVKKDVTVLGVTGTFEGSGGGTITNGVYFMDYDGTVVETWDATTVSSKTALPNNPSHTGLIAEGWNWTLQSIKDYIQNYPQANVYVGQTYHTASGLTEIDITVTKVTGLSVTCKMSGTKNWGDGTQGSGTSHTYADYGNYTITCDGTSIPSGTSSSGGMFSSSSGDINCYWCTAIRLSNIVTSIRWLCF